jgi:hypothetical protein
MQGVAPTEVLKDLQHRHELLQNFMFMRFAWFFMHAPQIA